MTIASSLPLARAPSGLRWALVPVFLLASSVIGVGSMAYVATHDPSFSTEPDYYQKAVRWDQTQAQAGENQRLGYELALPPRVLASGSRQATLELSVRDRIGQPVKGASIHAEAFANLAADDVSSVEFTERAPGSYVAVLTARHLGVWNVRVRAAHGADRFTAELRTELVPGRAP